MLDDARIIRRALAGQIAAEAHGGGYWCAFRAGGHLVTKEKGRCRPLVPQRVAAIDLLDRLNREVHHDGTWIVAWADPVETMVAGGLLSMPVPQRLVWMHKDGDGDVNVAVDTDDSIEEIAATLDQRVDDAAKAMQKYREIMADVEVRPDQTRKAALGQPSADPTLKRVPLVA